MFGLRVVPAKAFVTHISFKRLHARHHQLWLPATASWPFTENEAQAGRKQPRTSQLLFCWAVVGHHLKSPKLHQHFNSSGKKWPQRDEIWQVFEVLYLTAHPSQNSSTNPDSCFSDLAPCLARRFCGSFTPFKALDQVVLNTAQSRAARDWEKRCPRIPRPLPLPPSDSACHQVVPSPYGSLLFSGQISVPGL